MYRTSVTLEQTYNRLLEDFDDQECENKRLKNENVALKAALNQFVKKERVFALHVVKSIRNELMELARFAWQHELCIGETEIFDVIDKSIVKLETSDAWSKFKKK